MNKPEWRGVISSIEETAPLYDEVNEIISLRRTGKARAYAAQRLMEDNPKLVLDSGVGPGSMSIILLQGHAHARCSPRLFEQASRKLQSEDEGLSK